MLSRDISTYLSLWLGLLEQMLPAWVLHRRYVRVGEKRKGRGAGTCVDVLVYSGVRLWRYAEDEEGGVGGGGARLLGAALTPAAGETS